MKIRAAFFSHSFYNLCQQFLAGQYKFHTSCIVVTDMKAMLIIAILIVATLKSVQLEKAGLQEWDKACRKESGLNQGDEDCPEFKDYLMCMYIELELVDKEGHINKAKFKDIYPGSAILDNVDKCVEKFDEVKDSSLGDKLVNLQLCLDPHIMPKK